MSLERIAQMKAAHEKKKTETAQKHHSYPKKKSNPTPANDRQSFQSRPFYWTINKLFVEITFGGTDAGREEAVREVSDSFLSFNIGCFLFY